MGGLAHIQLALLMAVVVAAVGLVAWKVTDNRSTIATGINQDTQSKCITVVNDKLFCKFAGVFANVTNYKATISITDQNGASANYDLAYDGKNNSSMVVKQNGQEQGNIVVYSGVTYSKDYSDGQWFKYGTGDKNTPQFLDLKKEFLKADFKGDNGQKLEYKNLSTEKCGELKCYKYQETDPQKPTETNYLWFDTKDYLLRRVSANDGKTSTEMTVTYASVSITQPSPTKDAPVTAQ